MEIKILITGDYCPIGRIEKAIDENDFTFISEFAPYSQNADLAITNLESPLTLSNHKILKSGPNIKAKPNAIKPLVEGGFNLVTMANNHILDYGNEGVYDSIKVCKENGIDHLGAGESLREARSPLYKNIKGKKIAVLNFAENEFCAATQTTSGANPVNLINNHKDIIEAKKQVDYLIVIAHGGREHYQLPTPQLRERYRFYADSGADMVVGHHTHCYSGFEIYNDKHIFYSLGNFIFDYKKKYQKGMWTQGYAVEFTLNDSGINTVIIPFHQGREVNPNLVLFNELEKSDFYKKIEGLNMQITDDSKFENTWKNYLKTQEKTYKGMLLIQNDYIRAAISKGLLPKVFLHSKSHQTLLLNILRCESHREIMTAILEREIN